MTLTVKHAHQTAISDDGSDVGANAWNADHTITDSGTGGLILVTVALDFYITTGGSDSNDGSLANPWLTHQHAANYLSTHYYDPVGYGITVHAAAGTYVEGFQLDLGPSQLYFVEFLGASPATTILKASGSGGVIFIGGGNWFFSGYQIGEASPSPVPFAIIETTGGSSYCQVGNCKFGKASNMHLSSDIHSEISIENDITIIGTADNYIFTRNWGNIHHRHGALILNLDPLWALGCVFAERHSRVIFTPDSVSGSASTGPQWTIDSTSQVLYGTAPPGVTLGNLIGQDCLLSNGGVIVAPSFVGDSGGGGQIGYVPAPAAGDAAAGKFLKASGAWVAPSGSSGANPTATAGDVAINGSAATFLRSDGAPAIQKTSSTLFGLCKVDNSTITAAAGVITAVGGAASMVINSSTITGSTGNEVLYGDGTKLQQAAHFQITSGQPNTSSGSQYLYGSLAALYATNLAGDENWFGGHSGNLSVTGAANTCFGRNAGAALTSQSNDCYFGRGAGQSDSGGSDGNIAIGVNAMLTATAPTECIAIGQQCINTATGPFKTVAIGFQSLINAAGAINCVAVGHHAMTTTTGTPQNCVAIGTNTLNGAGLGNNNTAVGISAGAAMTSGSNNCLIGGSAGAALTTEASITCVGFQCGQSAVGLTTGDALFGYQAGIAVTSSGGNNLGIGTSAFAALAGGAGNVALGASAMSGILGGSNNMGIGSGALTRCTSGNANVGVGQNTLAFVTTTASNVAIGQNAGQVTTGSDNIFIGTASGIDVTTGSQNLLLGGIAGGTTGITTGSGNVLIGIGFTALGNPSNAIIIGTGGTPAGTNRADFNFTKANGWVFTASAGIYTTNANFMLRNTAGLTGGGTGNVPTLLAGPVTGDPTKWLPYDDNGTTRYIPAW